MVKLNIMSGDKVLSALDTEAAAEPPKEPEKVSAICVDSGFHLVEIGWYPVLKFYDPQEGFVHDACYWDGKEFQDCHAISHVILERYETREEAEHRAWRIEPDSGIKKSPLGPNT